MTERTTPPLQDAKGFVRTSRNARLPNHRKIAINMPLDVFERIAKRAKDAGVPFTVEAVSLLRCGLLDVEDSERHEPDWPQVSPP